MVPENAFARCQALMLMASDTLNGFPGQVREMPRLPFCGLVARLQGSSATRKCQMRLGWGGPSYKRSNTAGSPHCISTIRHLLE